MVHASQEAPEPCSKRGNTCMVSVGGTATAEDKLRQKARCKATGKIQQVFVLTGNNGLAADLGSVQPP